MLAARRGLMMRNQDLPISLSSGTAMAIYTTEAEALCYHSKTVTEYFVGLGGLFFLLVSLFTKRFYAGCLLKGALLCNEATRQLCWITSMWRNFGELNYRKISLCIKWREVIPERRTAEEEFNGGTDWKHVLSSRPYCVKSMIIVPHSSLFILLVWWYLGREVYRVIIQDEFLKSYKSSTGFTYNYLEFC